MSFNVRVTAYRGMVQLPKVLAREYSSDSVYMLSEPYEWSSKLTSNGTTVVSSSPDTTHAQVKMVRIEVADGNAVRYEIGPSGSVRTPGDSSPILTGISQFPFNPGDVFSMVDAASYP